MNLTNHDALNAFMNDLFNQIDDNKEQAIVDKIESVVTFFETSSLVGDYDEVVVYADGKGGSRQVTFGKAQTTEQGNLVVLLEMYVANGGTFSQAFKPYIEKLKMRVPLANETKFKKLLEDSARTDEIMRDTQDEFFKEFYLRPAAKWFDEQGFELPLSLLVIYDSFVHSGGILNFLRKRFKERPPVAGGDEKAWISAYVQVRKVWLSGHSNAILRKTVYRMMTFQDAIAKSNWNLDLPLQANGKKI